MMIGQRQATISPTVSVILPTFNRLQYLRPAVESVLAQTFQDWELIIADDGSNAQTQAFLKTLDGIPRVRLFWLTHTGKPSVVRNAAIREATGEYLAFVDSDDIWMPSKIETQVASLRSRPACQWSYTGFVLVDGSCRPLTGSRAVRCPPIAGWILDRLLKQEALVTSVMVTRSLIEAVGGYDEECVACEDYDLWLRLALRSEVDFVDEPLVFIRRHDQHSFDDVTTLTELRRVVEKAQRSGANAHVRSLLQRRRAEVSGALAASHAVSGNGTQVLSTLVRSAHYSWRYGNWWRSAFRAAARGFVPASVLTAVRRYVHRGRSEPI